MRLAGVCPCYPGGSGLLLLLNAIAGVVIWSVRSMQLDVVCEQNHQRDNDCNLSLDCQCYVIFIGGMRNTISSVT